MDNKSKSNSKCKEKSCGKKKTATNNQWTSNHLKSFPDERPRQDGPGGN